MSTLTCGAAKVIDQNAGTNPYPPQIVGTNPLSDGSDATYAAVRTYRQAVGAPIALLDPAAEPDSIVLHMRVGTDPAGETTSGFEQRFDWYLSRSDAAPYDYTAGDYSPDVVMESSTHSGTQYSPFFPMDGSISDVTMDLNEPTLLADWGTSFGAIAQALKDGAWFIFVTWLTGPATYSRMYEAWFEVGSGSPQPYRARQRLYPRSDARLWPRPGSIQSSPRRVGGYR